MVKKKEIVQGILLLVVLKSEKAMHSMTSCLFIHGGWAIGNSGNGNWKRKMERENRNGQNLMEMNLRVKSLINDHLLKTIFITSIQRPQS